MTYQSKSYLLYSANAIAALLFWFFVHKLVFTGFLNENFIVGSLILLLFLSSMLLMSLVFLKSTLSRFLLIACVAVPFFILFGLSPSYFTGFLVMLGFYFLAGRDIQDDLTRSVRISIRAISSQNLWLIITPLFVMISLGYYQTPAVQESSRQGVLPSQIQRVVQNTAAFAIEKEIINVPAQQRQQFERQLINQVVSQISRAIKPYVRFIPPLLAFGLFLILQGLSFIFVYLALPISITLFHLLKKVKFFEIGSKKVEADVLKF